MKQLLLLTICLAGAGQLAAQHPERPKGLPLTVTLFSESVSLPNFRNIFRNGHFGVRVGTELYYKSSLHRQWFQTINLGYYRHRYLHNGLYLSSEMGYRKFFGNAFADATVGLGGLMLDSALPRYQPSAEGYSKASSVHFKLMPTLGMGAGYRFNQLTVFSRYELFGEMPFGFKGIPALPHKAIHVGTRFSIK